jgi:hypothetical protein
MLEVKAILGCSVAVRLIATDVVANVIAPKSILGVKTAPCPDPGSSVIKTS